MAGEDEQSKRPGSSAFKQQRLKAWQPLLTPKVVLPTFFIIGLIFVPLGVALYLASEGVNEITLDYTGCFEYADEDFKAVEGQNFEWKVTNSTPQICTLRFEAPQIKGPVYLYYRLTNFYQNHRRYVKSFNSDQLRGTAVAPRDLSGCQPLGYLTPTPSDVEPTIAIYPCGLIANSIFNDTLSNLTRTDDNSTFAFSEKGIAWPGDSKRYGNTQYGKQKDGTPIDRDLNDTVVPPPNWTDYPFYSGTSIPDLSQDEHFQVWMRTAGLPTFRKLYGKTDSTLEKGTYEMNIALRYDVTGFKGTKSVVISNTSWVGGKNPFLGIAYLVVGSICFVLGFAFLLRHLIAPRKLGDHSYIKWN